ncbi:MAG: lipopolysaccharide biosynthesis protein [bacterium]|nr:lipopolysaccharide biosynthesis protein [bacterium]
MSTAKKAIAGTFFVGVSSYINIGLNLFFSIVLARLLLPEHYGVLAMATVYATFLGLAREWGIASAILYKKDEVEKTAQTLFWLQMALAAVSVLLVFLSYPLVVRAYNPTLWWALLILTLGGVVQAVGLIPKTLLEKEISFKGLSVVEVAAIGFSGVIAIWMAKNGFGLWSLAAQRFLEVAFRTVGAWGLRPWIPAWGWDKQVVKWFFKTFGWPIWLSGIASLLLFQFDKFIVGNLIGTESLGFYAKAFSLASLPTGMVTGIVSRVTFPVYAQYQDQKEKLTRAFSLVTSGMWRLALPISLGLVLSARELVEIMIGARWLPMVPIFQLLLIYSMVRVLLDDTGPFLSGGLGKPVLITKALFLQAIILVVISPLFVWRWGASGEAAAVSVVAVVGIVYIYRHIAHRLSINFFQIFMAPAVSSLVGVALALGLSSLAPPSLWGQLLSKSLTFAGGYLLFLWTLERKWLREEFEFFKGLYLKS